MHEESHSTGEKDKTYDLFSIIYHALQGAETVDMYIRDAEGAGDKELVTYFRNVQKEYRQLADEGKRLISSRLQGGV